MVASHRRVSPLWETLLIFTLLIVLFSRFLLAFFIIDADAVLTHPDESQWIYMGRFFWTFFIDKDIENPEWHEYHGITQPPLGKYIIGFALYASGHKRDEIRPPWQFGKSPDWNIKHGRFPRPDHLRVVRLTMAIFGGLVGVVFYFIGRRIYGIRAGFAACLLWALNPLASRYSRWAMTDAPLLFFLFSTLLINLHLVSHFCRKRPISYFKTLGLSCLAGVSLFLAAGTKLNGGLAGLAFIAVMGVFLVQGCLKPSFLSGLKSSVVKLSGLKRQFSRYRLTPAALMSIILLVVISLSLFVLCNPMLYDKPARGIKRMLRHRSEEIQGQRALDPRGSLNTLPQKVTSVYQRVFCEYRVFPSIFRLPVDLILLFLGLTKLVWDEIKSIKSTRCLSEKGALLIWAIVVISGTTLWIPFVWLRYHLPILAFNSILMGIGVVFLLELIGKASDSLKLRIARSKETNS